MAAKTQVANPFTKKELEFAIHAIFTDGSTLADELVAAKQVTFVPSSEAHLYVLCGSMVWGLCYERVTNTFVPPYVYNGAALADFPKIGTHAYESAWEDKHAEERQRELKSNDLEIALIVRAAEHYGPIAKDNADEAGRKSDTGSRTDYLKRDGTKVDQFDKFGYVKGLHEFCLEELTKHSKEDRPKYVAQLEACLDVTTPHPDLQNAMAYMASVMDSDRLEVLSGKRYVKLVSNSLRHGEELALWEKAQLAPKETEAEKAAYAKARKTYGFSQWRYKKDIERFLGDWDLVIHTDVPQWLVQSVYWRTEKAKLMTEMANAKTMEALATVAEVTALGAQEAANDALEDVKESIEHQRDLNAERRHAREIQRAQRQAQRDAELAQFYAAPAAPVAPVVTEPAAAPVVEPVAPKVPKGINGARSMKTNSGAASASQLRR